MSKDYAREGGLNCGSLFIAGLALIFIALKLLGYIDWSWAWVLSPIWISLLLSLIFIAGVFVAIVVSQD